MATTEKTPLWLELKKDYIDDNFSKLQVYLRNCDEQGARDSFYTTTIELFRERISDLLRDISERPIYADEQERQQLTANVSMLATYLLADGRHSLALPAYVAFMNGLRQMNPSLSDLIVKTLMQRIRHEKVTNLGFSWKDLEKMGTELFAHNVCRQAKFDHPLSKPQMFTRYGTALLTQDGLMLTHENKADSKKLLKDGSNSIDTGIGITLRTLSSQKLKQSLANSVKDMDEFTKDFILYQAKIQNKPAVPKLKSYDAGDEVIVKVVSIDHDVHVETVDPSYQKITGTIKYERPSLVYYYTNELYKFFHAGDHLTATVKDPHEGVFSIEGQLTQFFAEYAEDCAEYDGDTMPAKLIDDKTAYTVWLTSIGVAVQVEGVSPYRRGDYALITVNEFCKGKRLGLIKGYIAGSTKETFSESSARHDCIRVFAEYTEAPVYQRPEEDTAELSPVLLRLLLRLLFDYQKLLLKPSERFRYLANANVMAEMVGDDLSASYISFVRTYLRALIQFVNGEDINAIHLEPDEEYSEAKSTLLRLAVIDLLKEYGRKDNSEKLAQTISDFEKRLPQLARLARLIQTANSMLDILSGSARNVIHREIIRTLSLETETDTDLEADRGTYLGIESGTQEFKTSMVYPPDNHMKPDEFAQNANIMKAVCAFLNTTTGGTLYLGVNDQGYVVGIDNDMKYLKVQTIDAYMRYVQDTVKKHFGIDALPYLHTEPLYDDKVVAMHIAPHPYRVVELNGTAYLRFNAESRIMPEQLRLQMLARKVFTNKNRAAAISLLQQAYSQKRCAILHGYASNNSGGVEDRLIEPYDVRPEDNLVVAYDIDRKGTRVFNFNRIGYVEILPDKSWTNAERHKAVFVDVFHMSDDNVKIHISLQLDLMAKNLLVEEFPRAKDYLKGHKGDENIWYFDTDVCRLEGIGRFYVGLANHITILDGEPLKQYAAEYAKKYLSF
jgi:predicted DNA-binding transcriptional regulator YafY